jgi:hypothetical protein
MTDLKDKGLAFIGACNQIGQGRSREFALAITKMEEAVMWACKGVTR